MRDIITEEEIDKRVVEKFKEMIDENPTKMFMFFLSKIGEMMVDTNADHLTLSSEMTIEEIRYKVTSVSKIKKLRKDKNAQASDATDDDSSNADD